MALLRLLVLLALVGSVWATWDTCRGTCGLRPMAFDHSSVAAEYSQGKDYQSLDPSNGPPQNMGGSGVHPGAWPGEGHLQVGSGDRGNGSEPAEAKLRHIQSLMVHQYYDPAMTKNNIALLQLDQAVECSDYIQLGCVPDSSLAVPELKKCYIAGWRATPDSAPGLRLVLQEAKVRLIDVQLCKSSR